MPQSLHRRCILVVEDEFLLRMMVSEVLREADYTVIEAVNGDEALTVLQSAVRVDLIVSDVRMPGSLDGLGLLALVNEEFPAIPVVLTSGYIGPPFSLPEGACQFIPKPYAMEALLSAIEAGLAARA